MKKDKDIEEEIRFYRLGFIDGQNSILMRQYDEEEDSRSDPTQDKSSRDKREVVQRSRRKIRKG